MIAQRAPLPAGVDGLPALPPAALAALDAGLRELGLADLGGAPRSALADHLRLLLAWTTAINLTSVRDPVAAVRTHLLDSLAALPLFRERGLDTFLDLGSGGGLPGIPLAVVLPARRAMLVESVAKKARFLETAVAALRLDGTVAVAARRAEQLAGDASQRQAWPVVTARAVVALPELVELAFPLLAPGGILIAWTSARAVDERAGNVQARALVAIGALGGGTLEVRPAGLSHAPGHVLVVARKTGRSDARWPRSPSERRRRPW